MLDRSRLGLLVCFWLYLHHDFSPVKNLHQRFLYHVPSSGKHDVFGFAFAVAEAKFVEEDDQQEDAVVTGISDIQVEMHVQDQQRGDSEEGDNNLPGYEMQSKGNAKNSGLKVQVLKSGDADDVRQTHFYGDASKDRSNISADTDNYTASASKDSR